VTKSGMQARTKFKSQVLTWSEKLKVKPSQVRIQRMTRKWGSCSTAGWVTFSEDLLAEPKKFQEYVIVHELLHLKVPNHGKLFKALLKTHLGVPTLRDSSILRTYD
jgi:predicted metal-dependent hydrolase